MLLSLSRLVFDRHICISSLFYRHDAYTRHLFKIIFINYFDITVKAGAEYVY